MMLSPIPARDHPGHATAPRAAPGRGQLRDARAPEGKDLAREASAVPAALHADLGLMAQLGRALLCLDHPAAHPARRPHERA